MLPQGALVGHKYRIVRALGRGGMGMVYEAVQEPLSRRVAVKTILPEYAARDAAFARFRREAESSAALGHPNIVQVTDFQVLPGEPPLLVMELLEGRTLREAIDLSGKMDPTRAAFIAMQILSGLEAAHRAGIVHRDIKPANVFLSSTLAVRDLVKILDFGVAKLVLDAHASADDKLTAFGQVLGTLAYMAPEQAHGREGVDHRADLYAVGATLFHMLTGMTPLGARVLGAPPPSMRDSAPWVHPGLSAVIDRALAYDPAARWTSAEEMAAALAPFAESGRASVPSSGGGYDPAAAARLSAPTLGGTSATVTTGGTVGGAPTTQGFSGAGAPPAWSRPSHTPGPAAPLVTGATSASHGGIPKWAIALIVVAAVSMVLAYAVPMVMVQLAVSPSRLEERAERGFLENARLKPCPLGETCTGAFEDHGVTFPVCSKAPPRASSISPGDALLVRRDGDARVLMVNEPRGDGKIGGLWVTSRATETTVSTGQVLARVCSPTRVSAPAGLED